MNRAAELQQEQMIALFTQAPNPVVMLRGPDYVIELANPHVCKVWGRRHEDVINRPLLDALPELRGQVFKDMLDKVMRTGIPQEGKEAPARLDRRGDGDFDTVYFNFVYAPVRNAAGAVDGVLVIAFDVTDEVAARRQVDTLRSQAEAANRAKDEFLAMLGHELRNPLAPIVTTLQLMRLRGMQSAELEVLERQVGHLTRMVDDLLDVARITRGRIELRKRRIEVAEAVIRAMELTSPLLEQRGHQVDLQVARTGLGVIADCERLAQVFANILTNAAKYSEAGSRIAVRARRVEDRVQIKIRDHGMGIHPELIDYVFDLFMQQPQTLARSQGGLGLGLAIVRNLVKLHGGSVHAHSDGVGKGSEFTVELPAVKGAVYVQMPGRNLPLHLSSIQSRRILVVDDNAELATTLCEALQTLGHIVAMACDGPAALNVAKSFRPQVGLLDIGLPAMDGYELAQRLRGLPHLQPIRLIATSGYGVEIDRQRARASGFQTHLEKPIDLTRLHRMLAPALMKRPGGLARRIGRGYQPSLPFEKE
ncbi:MAG TPA: ATP-binding protein [Gammaproteobacteria bacterium]|nr:ATP-binding protein [Gammaproteobacteria bacterium]